MDFSIIDPSTLGTGYDFFNNALTTDPSGLTLAGTGSAAAATPSFWDRAGDWLGSEKGTQALSKLGTSLLGAASQADPRYLRIQAGAAPYTTGNQNSLLNTMLQMKLQQQQQQQFPLGQNFRSSLLG